MFRQFIPNLQHVFDWVVSYTNSLSHARFDTPGKSFGNLLDRADMYVTMHQIAVDICQDHVITGLAKLLDWSVGRMQNVCSLICDIRQPLSLYDDI